MNFKNCVFISWKIQILTILRHKITQIFTINYYLLFKFSKLHNLESQFCELLRPQAPLFQKIKRNPLKSGHFYAKILLFRTHLLWNSTTELILDFISLFQRKNKRIFYYLLLDILVLRFFWKCDRYYYVYKYFKKNFLLLEMIRHDMNAKTVF
jgi:hypothetical protein